MFEVIVLIYLCSNLAYIYYAYKKYGIVDNDFLFTVGQPIGEKIGHHKIIKMITPSGLIKLNKLYTARALEQGKYRFQVARIGMLYTIVFLGGLFGIIMGRDYVATEKMDYAIERPAYGEGNETIEATYKVMIEGETHEATIPIILNEQVPKKAIAKQVLEEKAEQFKTYMLGNNVDENHITTDLWLPEAPYNQQIVISYEVSNDHVINERGKLKLNLMETETAYPFSISATFEYGDAVLTKVYDFVAYKPEPRLLDQVGFVPDKIIYEEEQIVLPNTVGSQEANVLWERPEVGIRGEQIFVFFLLIGIVLYVLKEQDLNQKILARQEEILYDFPGVVNKLTILINAGMTFGRAWHKIVTDYEQSSTGKRILYEEMVLVSKELQMGVPETEALEAFGKRCKNIEVIRLSTLLIQNLKRGSHSLTLALKELSVEAWHIRTTNARKLGEKASTKLLIPMGISLITVLLVVMAPTFMQMQI